MEPSADYRNYHNLPSIIGQWLKLTCHNEDTAGCSMKERAFRKPCFPRSSSFLFALSRKFWSTASRQRT